MIVLDSSAAIDIALGTDEGMALEALFLQDEKIISCDFLVVECTNVLRKMVRWQQINKEDASRLLEKIINIVDDFWPTKDLRTEVLNESIRLNHAAYDVFYFVLARRTGSTLVTLDKKLMDLADKNGVDIIHEIDF